MTGAPDARFPHVYIVDGLLQQQSKAEPKEIHADTQGQSLPVFGLAYLFGFDLLPRIRNFKDRVFLGCDRNTAETCRHAPNRW